jgi:hypothetical protein
MDEESKKKVMKCLKSYLSGKKYYEIDNNKSFEYFKQCITLINKIKFFNLDEEYSNIINETETECSKYLTMTIENTIERPIIRKNRIRNIENTHNDSNNVETNELFNIIETGDIMKINNYKYGDIDFKVYNNAGLTPLHMAVHCGDTNFLKKCFILGASIDSTNKYGHTLLEYACLENDPNMIDFLYLYGADMKKHLIFRNGQKYFNKGDSIDIILLQRIIMDIKDFNNIKYLEFIFDYIDKNQVLDINYEVDKKDLIFYDLVIRLDRLLGCLKKEARQTYIDIIKEELSYNLMDKLGCPTNKLEILLYNLVPFIGYSETLKLNWLLSLEIKYLILKILKNKNKINTKELKGDLQKIIHDTYIKNNIVPEGLIQVLLEQWNLKIKV